MKTARRIALRAAQRKPENRTPAMNRGPAGA
jgi:hypothetical protein